MVKDYKLLPRLNPNARQRVKCKNCGKIEEHHAKGYCHPCYRKFGWARKKLKCKSCGRERYHKAFGLCGGCHVRIHHYDKTLAFNAKRYHGIDNFEFYQNLTKECASCGFTKVVQLHHLDGDTRNNDLKNVLGLCPNCHKMIHMYVYYREVMETLRKKGYDFSKVHP